MSDFKPVPENVSENVSPPALVLFLFFKLFCFYGPLRFYVNFRIGFSYFVHKSSLGFWYGLYESIDCFGIVLTSQQYCLPIIHAECVSIYVCFVSLMFCSFYCTNLSPPWLNYQYFLSISFFLILV